MAISLQVSCGGCLAHAVAIVLKRCVQSHVAWNLARKVAWNVLRNVAWKVAWNVDRNIGRKVFEDEKSQCVLCEYILGILFWDYFRVLKGTKL